MKPDAERYEFLDWLRVIAIFILVFFHTGMLFTGWGWHIVNDETIPALRLPMDIAHRLRMPLLFVIAGAGMWFALRRRSGGALLRERTLRLLVPLVAGMLLIVPPQVYVERLVSGDWHGGYLPFIIERVLRFEPYPAGDTSWHHLWFIAYLYVYVLLLLPAMLAWRRSERTLAPGAWIFLLGLPLGINEALLKPHFPESHALVNDWYIFDHYLLLTACGVLLASLRGGWDWLAARRHVSLGISLVVSVIGLTLLETGAVARDTPFDALFATTFTWLWLMVFLGYGRNVLSFGNRFLAWAREASYPVYILHQTVIVVLAYFIVPLAWTPWVKFGVVVTATLAISVLFHHYVLRRFALTRTLFGIKTHAPASATRSVSGHLSPT